MSENIENLEMAEKEGAENANMSKVGFSFEYVLTQIEEIRKQMEYLNEVITKLADIEASSAGWDGDISGDGNNIVIPSDTATPAKAQALTEIVRCRETTNQQMLRMYEKMLDKLTGGSIESQVERGKWEAITHLADIACHEDDFASERAEMLDSIRQILRENK